MALTTSSLTPTIMEGRGGDGDGREEATGDEAAEEKAEATMHARGKKEKKGRGDSSVSAAEEAESTRKKTMKRGNTVVNTDD